MNRTTLILPVIVIAVAAALSSIFIVDEREKALVLQFGQAQPRAIGQNVDIRVLMPGCIAVPGAIRIARGP